MDTDTIRQTMAATCAICCLKVPPEEYLKNRSDAAIVILGSAFLVRPTTAITNRHVLVALHQFKVKESRTDSDLVLWFVYPTANGSQEAYCRLKHHGIVQNRELDIGLIEFVRRPEAEFEACRPLPIVPQCAPKIGESVAASGFPYGVNALRVSPGETFYRAGPVLQQGHVSATAPHNFCRADELTRIVLDVRTAGGMSGGPVVRKIDGSVLGIHQSGMEATMSFAIPVDQERLTTWLQAHDASRSTRAATVT